MEAILNEIKKILNNTKGVILMDNPKQSIYPTPLLAKEKNEVLVGRIRVDESQDNSINLWICADNLRKGAATNAVQIAQYIVNQHYI